MIGSHWDEIDALVKRAKEKERARIQAQIEAFKGWRLEQASAACWVARKRPSMRIASAPNGEALLKRVREMEGWKEPVATVQAVLF